MIRHAALPVPIPAVIPVTDVAMIPVRPERQKTIPVPMLPQPSAVRAATDVKTVRPARPTGTVLMSVLQNAVAAILVPIPVLQVPVAEPAVLPVMTRFMSVRPNAAQAVTAVRSIITLIPARTAIRPQAALVIMGMIPRQNPVPAVRQTALATNARLNRLSRHALIMQHMMSMLTLVRITETKMHNGIINSLIQLLRFVLTDCIETGVLSKRIIPVSTDMIHLRSVGLIIKTIPVAPGNRKRKVLQPNCANNRSGKQKSPVLKPDFFTFPCQ